MQIDISGVFQSFSARFTIREDTVDEVNPNLFIVTKAKEVQAQGKEYTIALIIGKKGNEYIADAQDLAAFFDKEKIFVSPQTKEECAKVYLFVLRNKETIFKPISTSAITRWPPSAIERKRFFSIDAKGIQSLTPSPSRNEATPQPIERPLVNTEAPTSASAFQLPPPPQLPLMAEKKEFGALQIELTALKAQGPQGLELAKSKAREMQALYPQETLAYNDLNLLIDLPLSVFSEHNMRVYEQWKEVFSSRCLEVNLAQIYLSSSNPQIQNKADPLIENLLHKDPETFEASLYTVAWLEATAQECVRVNKVQYAKALYEKIIDTKQEAVLTAEQLLECQQRAAVALISLPQDSDGALIACALRAIELGAKLKPDQAVDIAKKARTLADHIVRSFPAEPLAHFN